MSSNEQNVFEVVEGYVRVFEQTTHTHSQKVTVTLQILSVPGSSIQFYIKLGFHLK